jgi:hypothetical protein
MTVYFIPFRKRLTSDPERTKYNIRVRRFQTVGVQRWCRRQGVNAKRISP